MKVKVNIINMRCILMSEAVTMPSLMMMTVSEESLARDTHTHTHTHRLEVLYLKLFQSKTLKTKRATPKQRTTTEQPKKYMNIKNKTK